MKKTALLIPLLCCYSLSYAKSLRPIDTIEIDDDEIFSTEQPFFPELYYRTIITLPILKIIDGKHGILDGNKIHKSIWLGQEISRYQYGNVDPKTKKRIPQHEFMGKYYTLEGLVVLEQTLASEHHEAFAALLTQLKKQFMAITGPVLDDAHGAQRQMEQLIAAWCKEAHRGDSLLLRWSTAEDETQSFNQNVTSVKILNQFCTDLFTFLKDLVRSCPRAFRQYKDWYNKGKKV